MSYAIPKRLKGTKGFSAIVESFGLEYIDDKAPFFSISLLGSNKQLYKINFENAKPDPLIVRKAILFFRHDPQWRQHFEVTAQTPYWSRSSPEPLSTYDPLANLLLESIGVQVMSYNKGSEHPYGSDCELSIYGGFDPEVMLIAESIGWRISDNRIKVSSPRGFSHSGRELFILFLDDWDSDNLDPTGQRYIVNGKPEQLFPRWPSYPDSALLENEKINRKQAEKMNKFVTHANFDHYARLVSGRDTFSKMTTDELIKKLGEDDDALKKLNEIADNPIIFTKSLRWRLRGLNVMHTLEKYRVDDILHNFAENERERKRAERIEGKKQAEAVMAVGDTHHF